MPKIIFEKYDNIQYPINFSVYKQDKISTIWNWFTRKNKAEDLPKPIFDNCKIKLDTNTLKFLKENCVDLKKLYIASRSKKKSLNKNKVILLQKTSLGSKEKNTKNDFVLQHIVKQKPFTDTTKTFKNNVRSSTFSIKSNGSVKYVNNKKSQISVVHSVASCKINSTARCLRSVLLKSVPPAVLNSNLQKKVFLPINNGKRKGDVEDKLLKNQTPENKDNHKNDKCDSDLIPMLLTKIKSMEGQISDMDTKTKNIKDTILQQQIFKSPIRNNEPERKINTKENTKVETKILTTHKSHLKKSNPMTKIKKYQKKLRNKQKMNYASGHSSKSAEKNENHNLKAIKNLRKKNRSYKKNSSNRILVRDTEKVLDLVNTRPISCNIFQANSNISCDMVFKLLKALSEVTEMSNSMKSNLQSSNNHEHLKLKNNINCLDTPNTSKCSKPTFDWKHKSASATNILQDENINQTQTRSMDENKNYPGTLGKESFTKYSGKGILEKLANSDQVNVHDSFEQNIFFSSLNVLEDMLNGQMYAEHNPSIVKEMLVENSDNIHKVHDLTHRNQGVQENRFLLIETQDCEHSDQLAFEKPVESQTWKNKCVVSEVKNTNKLSTIAIEQCSTSLCEAENGIFTEQLNPTENLMNLAGTTIASPNANKDPRVSITILVEDDFKNEIDVKSNVAVEIKDIRDLNSRQKEVELHFPALSSTGGNGHSECNAKDEKQKESSSDVLLNSINDLKYTKSVVFSSNLSKQCEKNLQSYMDCYSDVNIAKTKLTEDYNLGHYNQGLYLNQEKRKALEEHLFEAKVKNKEANHPRNTSLIICSTVLNHNKSAPILEPNYFLSEKSTDDTLKISTNNSAFGSFLCKNINSEEKSAFRINKSKPVDKLSIDGYCYERLKQSTEDNLLKNKEKFEENERSSTVYKLKSLNTPTKEKSEESSDFDDFKRNQKFYYLDSKRRTVRHSLTLSQDQIVEQGTTVGSPFLKLNGICHQSEKGDSIKIQDYNENLHRKSQEKNAILEVNRSVAEKLDSGGLNKPIVNNYCPIRDPEVSSVYIQTDWSLVGITVEHFQSEAALKEYKENINISVSTQTKAVEQQTDIIGKERIGLECNPQLNVSCPHYVKVEDKTDTCNEYNNKLVFKDIIERAPSIHEPVCNVDTSDIIKHIQRECQAQISFCKSPRSTKCLELTTNGQYTVVENKVDKYNKINNRLNKTNTHHLVHGDTPIEAKCLNSLNSVVERVQSKHKQKGKDVKISVHKSPKSKINLSKFKNEDVQNHGSLFKDQKEFSDRGMKNFHKCSTPCFHPVLEEMVVFETKFQSSNYQSSTSSELISNNGSACKNVCMGKAISLENIVLPKALTSIQDQLTGLCSNPPTNIKSATKHINNHLNGLESGDENNTKNPVSLYTSSSYFLLDNHK